MATKTYPSISSTGTFSKEVYEFTSLAGFPTTGEAEKIYIALNTGTLYFWSGTAYVPVSGTGGGGVTDHSLLSGLSGDDHPQYFNTLRGDARYAALAHTHSYDPLGSSSSAIAAHNASPDPHPQYLTQTEGDARYPQLADQAETIRDTVGATLVAGANVTINVSDVGDTITIAAAGAGGGATLADGSYGDVTVSGTGTVITINDGAVQLDDIENISTSSLLGRTTAGSGAPEVLTAPQVRTLINVENGATADQTGAEIVSLLDAQLGSSDWQSGGGGTGATNLGFSRDTVSVTVTSDTGNDAALPAATSSLAGVLTSADKSKLDGIEVGATGDMTGAEIVVAVNSALGGSGWQGGGGSIVVQEGDSTVAAAATTLDFTAADFDVTESPSGEANVAIAAAIARLASPSFTGTPLAPNASPNTNTTQIATTAYVTAERTTTKTLTNTTLTAPVLSGIVVADGAEVTSANAIAALVIDVTKKFNTKTVADNSTFTFSATPSNTNQWFGLMVTNSDSAAHVLTFPSSWDMGAQATRTTSPIAASGKLWLMWHYNGSTYNLFGASGYLNKYDATAAPSVGDDVNDGFGPGSLWLDATGNATYIMESNAAGAAVWHPLSAGAGVTDGDKGDLTVSGAGSVWTIDNGVVTLAKHANMATARVLGRATAGSGAPEEITFSQVLDMVTSATHGDIMFRGSSGWVRLAASTAGYYLQTQGGGADPVWAAGSGGGGSLTDGDKGDITVSASGATFTIDAGVVTLAKMADMATDSLIGRDTSGTGVPEIIGVGGGIEFNGAAIRTTAFTGDVTKTAGGTTLTIPADTVTYAKMQNVSATDKLLGRSTSGAGDVEEITCTAAGRAILDDADAAAQRTTLVAAARAQTFAAGCFIDTVADGTIRLAQKIPFGGTITNVVTKTTSGTCTVTGKINGTNLGGTANSASSTESDQTHSSANTFASGDDIDITISSNSSAVGLAVTVVYTRTLA